MTEYTSEFAAPLYTDIDRVVSGTKITRYILVDGELAEFEADWTTVRAGKAIEGKS